MFSIQTWWPINARLETDQELNWKLAKLQHLRLIKDSNESLTNYAIHTWDLYTAQTWSVYYKLSYGSQVWQESYRRVWFRSSLVEHCCPSKVKIDTWKPILLCLVLQPHFWNPKYNKNKCLAYAPCLMLFLAYQGTLEDGYVGLKEAFSGIGCSCSINYRVSRWIIGEVDSALDRQIVISHQSPLQKWQYVP